MADSKKLPGVIYYPGTRVPLAALLQISDNIAIFYGKQSSTYLAFATVTNPAVTSTEEDIAHSIPVKHTHFAYYL